MSNASDDIRDILYQGPVPFCSPVIVFITLDGSSAVLKIFGAVLTQVLEYQDTLFFS